MKLDITASFVVFTRYH